MHRTLLGLLSVSLLIQPAWAQSETLHSHPTPAPSASAPSELPPAAEDHDMSAHAGHGQLTPEVAALMERARSLGSGTALIPQTSPMRMLNVSTDDWLLMGHGDLVLGYNQQGTPRGALTWAAENWAMGMASRYWGPGILDLRIMGSLEALTLPPGGTPHLFQTGETYQGQPLRDKQHPHDLLMELAARYTWQITPDWSVFGYAGLAGEPALGPSAFMHRPSSADNHWAPLAHHLQDATHITYGLGTLGTRWQAFQLEASLFNGREPDENRFDLDFGPLDSWSARASWIPSPNWVTQISHGRLKNPEALLPGDVWRTTASVTHVQEVGPGLLSSTLVWGMNQEFHEGEQHLQSFGLESQYDWDSQRNHVYGRLEVVDKNALALSPEHDHALHRISALTLGGIRELYTNDWLNLGLGADATIAFGDNEVEQVYGPLPYGFRVYLRLRPPSM
ncbi:MAG: hypothetical protein ACO1RX_07965 [Candidatus Sericytochromatia bacterium]